MTLPENQHTDNGKKGQVTVETAVALLALIAALVFMSVYTQRAMQGHIFEGGQAVGTSFDPSDTYSDHERSSTTETTTMHPTISMIEAGLIPTVPAPVTFSTDGDARSNEMTLYSLPIGPLPREPAGWKWKGGVEMKSTWNVTRSSNADVGYENN